MNYRTVLKYFAVGLLIAVISFYLLQTLASGLSLDWASNLLIVGVPFLCLVIIICTGIIVSHIENK